MAAPSRMGRQSMSTTRHPAACAAYRVGALRKSTAVLLCAMTIGFATAHAQMQAPPNSNMWSLSQKAEPTGAASGTQGRSTTTPSGQEMSPSEWRARQLAAADRSDKILRDAQKQPGLLGQYQFLHLAYQADHGRAFQLIFGQYLSWYQTYIGDYEAARSTFSIAQKPTGEDTPSPLTLAGMSARPAADVIAELAQGRKAVFFNEAHSAPVTRSLTIQMLARLRDQGFNTFAAETLYDTDTGLQQRGYATADSGFYVQEPLYGEMVRTALKLGYNVVAYEADSAGSGDARERAGAENLYARVFQRDPQARLVVNAGFAHIQKSGKYLGGTSMAEFFHKISGIEPLAIEQTMLIEHAKSDNDHPYYRALVDATHASAPIVFVDRTGKPWSLKGNQYDMTVIFPPEVVRQGRPTWLALNGARVPRQVASDLCHDTYPCLIEARYANEGDDAVAADRVVLEQVAFNSNLLGRVVQNSGGAHADLFLRPGNYRLSGSAADGRSLFHQDIVVGADEARR